MQHMQKSMITMNVQLSNTISDLSGTTGLAIIRAILTRRNPGLESGNRYSHDRGTPASQGRVYHFASTSSSMEV